MCVSPRLGWLTPSPPFPQIWPVIANEVGELSRLDRNLVYSADHLPPLTPSAFYASEGDAGVPAGAEGDGPEGSDVVTSTVTQTGVQPQAPASASVPAAPLPSSW